MGGAGRYITVRRILGKNLRGDQTVDPRRQREASSRRFHWSAVPNPRISGWSIVEFSRSAFPFSSQITYGEAA